MEFIKHRVNRLVLLCLILSTSAWAEGFDKKVIDHVSEYNYQIPDGFVTTVQGTFKNLLTKMNKFADLAKHEEKEYQVSTLKKKFEGLNLYLSSDIIKVKKKKNYGGSKKGPNKYTYVKHYLPRKSKLFVFISGLFDGGKSGNSKSIAKELLQLGYHVAIISNPLSHDFVKAEPKYKLGHARSEAQTIFYVLEKLISELYERDLLIKDEIHMSGISHGAFMASIIAAMDSNNKKPLIPGSVTIFSPPYNLVQAARNLDQASESSKVTALDIGFFKLIKKVIGLMKIKDPSDIKDEQAQSAKAIVANLVFKKNLIEALVEYDKRSGNLSVPRDKKDFEKWKDDMTFIKYYEQYAYKAYQELIRGDAELEKWLDIYKQNTGKYIKIMTSQDDFLNDPMDWNNFSREEAIIFSHGGHMGYLSQKDWFRKFIELSF